MDDILKIAKNYSKEKHIELLPASENNILDSLLFLFDENWEEEGAEYPYEIITYLLDCYYVLPERPDLACLLVLLQRSCTVYILPICRQRSLNMR